MKENRYTMPQQFIDDPNVALKWKLYGYLNGFWISGKPVYARNDTLAKYFNKSERSIQSALSELEEIGLITKDIKGLSRYILPGGIKVEGVKPSLTPPRSPASPRGEAQPHHISDSILQISYSPAQTRELTYSKEDEPPEDSGRIVGKERLAYESLLKWAESEREGAFVNRLKQYKALKTAKAAKITSSQLKERWVEMAADQFWCDKGFDWSHVVASFDRKGV